jgi:hypothetical protein
MWKAFAETPKLSSVHLKVFYRSVMLPESMLLAPLQALTFERFTVQLPWPNPNCYVPQRVVYDTYPFEISCLTISEEDFIELQERLVQCFEPRRPDIYPPPWKTWKNIEPRKKRSKLGCLRFPCN